MSDSEFDFQTYLKRIGLNERPPATVAGVETLIQHQLFHIPFENLDIHLGREISLKPADLWQKIILGQRGGYCFELNALLGRALSAMQIPNRPLLARVHLTDPPSGRTHQLLLLQLKGEDYIADVGFGASGPRKLLPLRGGAHYQLGSIQHRLIEDQKWGYLLQTRDKGEWKDSYSFDRGWVTPEDIALGHFFTSHSPDTHFTRIKTVAIGINGGRITLRQGLFTQQANGEIMSKEIAAGKEYIDHLKRYFGIEIGGRFEDFVAPFGA